MTWKTICSSHELLDGMSREELLNGEIVAIFRNSGVLYAIDGVCMHQGGPIAKGCVRDGIVTCPWHGWQYELTTGCNAATKKKMLKTYQIREIDGHIEIDVPES
jgi:nitrite reductase/ring-hydroxylating ferredoxin subunit